MGRFEINMVVSSYRGSMNKISFNAIYWLIERSTLEGAVNLASPYPLPNTDFMAAIRKAWGDASGTARNKMDVGTGSYLFAHGD